MNESITPNRIHVGLITADGRQLFSPSETAPALVIGSINAERPLSTEREAGMLLARRGIIANSAYFLPSPTSSSQERGYLLAESTSRRIIAEDHNLSMFPAKEVREYVEDGEPEQLQRHFLRLILTHMNTSPGR